MTTPVEGLGNRPPPWVRRAILIWWGTGVGIWLAFSLAQQLRSILMQLALALFLSFAIEPLVDAFERRGYRRGVGAIVSILLILVTFIGFIAAMGTLIADQLNQLVDDLPGYIESAQAWLNDTFGLDISADDLTNQLQPGGEASRYASDVAGNLVGFGTTIVNVLFQLLTVMIFTFYLAADGPKLRRLVCSLFPPTRQPEILRVWELAVNKTGAYISSRVILAIVSAMFHWVFFSILGLPSAVAMAIWVGLISQFIPTIGTYIAGILPMLVALGIDPAKSLWVLALVIVYQQIENYLLQPRVTAQTLDMHPAVAIGAVLAGTSLFGAGGALLALPVVATLTGFSTAYIARHEVIETPSVASDAATGGFLRRSTDRGPATVPDRVIGSTDESGTDPDDDGLTGV